MDTKCATCGTGILSDDAMFCSKCGTAVQLQSIHTATAKINIPFWKRDIGVWVLFFFISVLFTMFFTTIHSGNKLSTNEISSAAFWPGVTGAYIWRKQSKNGWIGFGIGVGTGLLGLFLLAVLAGLFR
jgi:zinc-ribbon domain